MTAVMMDPSTRLELCALGPRGRMELLAEMAREDRERFARYVDLIDVMDSEGDHHADGHRGLANLLAAQTNSDLTTARAEVKAMKALRQLPDIRARLAAGEFSVSHVHSLAVAYGNPRARSYLTAIEAQIADWADLPYAEFDGRVRDFVRLADADGAEQRDRARHEHRSLHHSSTGDSTHGNYSCGNAQGAAIAKILDHFASKEFNADWNNAKNRVGDKVTKHDLARTAEQRRMDALHAICLTAAAATPGLQPPVPLVNLSMDLRTFDETVEWVTTGTRPAPDLTDIASRRCHTEDGIRIPPADALAAMLQGHVRRVVIDRGVVIDLGRRHRLFTGNARDAVMLRSVRCVWPGCDMPASKCEADHLDPWAAHGHTNAGRGCPLCDHHNRWKTRGFTTSADDTGQWHTTRPDGHQHQQPTLGLTTRAPPRLPQEAGATARNHLAGRW